MAYSLPMSWPRLFALASMAALLVGCKGEDGHGGTLARIEARGEIVWGADLAGGEPYVYRDDKDPSRIIGFEVDIMDALAARLGVRARMAQTNWSNLVPSLERGDFDVVVNGLEATPERLDRILLSRPYFIYAETLAVRTGAPYRTLDDLAGKPVGTLNQTYAYDLLRDSKVELRPYEGNEEPYMDLVAGRLDGVLLDNIIADRYGCDRAGVTCLPDDIARGTYVIGIRKADPELVVAIDAALEAMVADGELEKILRKWQLWDHRQSEPPPPLPEASPSRRKVHFDWEQTKLFLRAMVVTIEVSVGAFLLAVPLGLLLAIGRVYGGPISRGVARVYIELFRGTPVLLQLFVLYYGLSPYVSLGPLQAAIIGLGMNYAAYEAEVYRGALLALPRGQTEAAKALGLGPAQTLRHVLLPQAVRLALPAMTNDFVALLKDSSLISVLAVIELTKQMQITSADMRGWLIPGLACAAFYLALSLPLSELARRLERRLARDQRPWTL